MRLAFRDADGDVDLAAFAACGGAPVAVSEGSGDAEQVAFTNRLGAGGHPPLAGLPRLQRPQHLYMTVTVR